MLYVFVKVVAEGAIAVVGVAVVVFVGTDDVVDDGRPALEDSGPP